jgi:hypothetical protein
MGEDEEATVSVIGPGHAWQQTKQGDRWHQQFNSNVGTKLDLLIYHTTETGAYKFHMK